MEPVARRRGRASLTGLGNLGLAVAGLVYQTDITLVFPEVRLSEPVVTFAAFAVLTTSLNSAAGPEFSGARQSYEIRPLVGSASLLPGTPAAGGA